MTTTSPMRSVWRSWLGNACASFALYDLVTSVGVEGRGDGGGGGDVM